MKTVFIFQFSLFIFTRLKALSEQIRSADKKRPAVAFKARFELSGERRKPVVIEIVVVADVKRGSRIRVITGENLPADVRTERIVINARSQKRKARKLISRAQSNDVRVESRAFIIVAPQAAFRVIE